MIKTLSERERYVLTGGAVVLACIFVVYALILPYREAMDSLDTSISQRRVQLEEVKELQGRYRALKVQVDRLQHDLGRGSAVAPLLTFLEETAGRVAGRENLVLMRPLPSAAQVSFNIESTEFKLERIGLEQILRLLYEIEQARPPARVDSLHLKQRYDNASQLDMSITVSSARSH